MVSFYLLHIQIEYLVDKGILCRLLSPSLCLSSEFLLDQPHEEEVKGLFLGLLHHLIPEGSVKLSQEGAVVGDDVDCAIDGSAVVVVPLSELCEERKFIVGGAKFLHNVLASH